METAIILGVLAVVAVAIFISATFGFGDALVSMPLLTMLVGSAVAAPFVAALSLLTGIVVFLPQWRRVAWRQVLPLLFTALAVMPIGFYAGAVLDEQIMRRVLGVFVLVFALYSLFFRQRLLRAAAQAAESATPSPRFDYKVLPFGVLAGFFGGAYNISGPPAVLYGTLSGWRAEVFATSLQGFFFPLSLFAVSARVATGSYTPQVLWLLLLALPVVLAAAALGRYANARLQQGERFHVFIYLLLLALGTLLLL